MNLIKKEKTAQKNTLFSSKRTQVVINLFKLDIINNIK